jgi:hypothetical protein
MSAAHRHSVTSAKLRLLRLRLAALLTLIFLYGCAQDAVDPPATLTPDAQIAIGTGSLLAELGFSSEESILIFDDREYRVFLDGLAPSHYSGSGRIYNLSRPEEIQGDYLSQYDGRLLTSSSGIQIVLSPPLSLPPGTDHLQIDYDGRIFPRGEQTYPLQSGE